jgi:hypothetical protein
MKSKLQLVRDLLYERDEKKQTVFGEQPAPLSIDEKRALADGLSRFSELAETLRARGERLKESVEQISKMVEVADRMISESENDVVDKIDASRRSKFVKASLTELQKSANEVMIHERRMEAACEDIREGLSKYYDVR